MRREELGPLKNQRRQSSLEFLDTVGQVVNYSTLWGILDIVDLHIYTFFISIFWQMKWVYYFNEVGIICCFSSVLRKRLLVLSVVRMSRGLEEASELGDRTGLGLAGRVEPYPAGPQRPAKQVWA